VQQANARVRQDQVLQGNIAQVQQQYGTPAAVRLALALQIAACL
jgi:hypothetical protein